MEGGGERRRLNIIDILTKSEYYFSGDRLIKNKIDLTKYFQLKLEST